MNIPSWLICVDLDDTLIEHGRHFIEAGLQASLLVARFLGRCSPYPAELFSTHQEIDYALIDKRGYHLDNFPEAWVQTYRQHAARLGINADPHHEAQIRHAANGFLVGPYPVIDGVKQTLVWLNDDGHELHLVTAGIESFQMRKFRESGLERYFRSATVSLKGKRAEIERLAAGRKERVLMIGDSQRSDMRAAVEAGVTGVFVPGDNWPHHRDATLNPDAYYTLRAFHELPSLIVSLETLGNLGPRPLG